jgi:hypothetical protein
MCIILQAIQYAWSSAHMVITGLKPNCMKLGTEEQRNAWNGRG